MKGKTNNYQFIILHFFRYKNVNKKFFKKVLKKVLTNMFQGSKIENVFRQNKDKKYIEK